MSLNYSTLIICFVFVFLLALEPLLPEWIFLQTQRLLLFLKSFPLRLKLQWDIHHASKDWKRYLKMADEIMSDLRTDETNDKRTPPY